MSCSVGAESFECACAPSQFENTIAVFSLGLPCSSVFPHVGVSSEQHAVWIRKPQGNFLRGKGDLSLQDLSQLDRRKGPEASLRQAACDRRRSAGRSSSGRDENWSLEHFRKEQRYLAFRLFLLLLRTTFHVLQLFFHFLFHPVFHARALICRGLFRFLLLFMLVPLLLSLRHSMRPGRCSPKHQSHYHLFHCVFRDLLLLWLNGLSRSLLFSLICS